MEEQTNERVLKMTANVDRDKVGQILDILQISGYFTLNRKNRRIAEPTITAKKTQPLV